MTPTLDPIGIAEGRALLAHLPDIYCSILKSAKLNKQRADGGVVCKFEVPGRGIKTITGADSIDALHAVLLELASSLNFFREHFLHDPSTMEEAANESASRFKSKNRQMTVGVTMSASLKTYLQAIASRQGTSFADVSRRYTVIGFEDFDDKVYSVSSKSLLEKLSSENRKWQSSETEQVMLRLDPNQAVRLRATAMEYGKSVSELSAMCLAHGLVLQESLVEVEQRVEEYQGPAIRTLVVQLGVDAQATPLLSGILVGTYRAPKALLPKLSKIFETTESTLKEFFRLSFERRAVPAFKAQHGKPQVHSEPIPWEDAVKSLKLSSEKAKNLLDLDA